jgi:hypothetical protein
MNLQGNYVADTGLKGINAIIDRNNKFFERNITSIIQGRQLEEIPPKSFLAILKHKIMTTEDKDTKQTYLEAERIIEQSTEEYITESIAMMEPAIEYANREQAINREYLSKIESLERQLKELGYTNIPEANKERAYIEERIATVQEEFSQQFSSLRRAYAPAIRQLRKQYAEVVSTIEPLQEEYENTRMDRERRIEKEQELSIISRDKKLSAYYRRLDTKLTEYFIADKAIASGMVTSNSSTVGNLAGMGVLLGGQAASGEIASTLVGIAGKVIPKVIELTGHAIPIPGVSLVTSLIAGGFKGVASGIRVVDKQRQVNKARDKSKMVGGMEELCLLPGLIARKLTIRYQDQIKRLSAEDDHGLVGKGKKLVRAALNSIDVAADCAAGRVIVGLVLLDDISGGVENVYERASDVVELVGELSLTQGALGIMNTSVTVERIIVESDKKWTEAGMYLRSGIRVGREDATGKVVESYYSRRGLRGEEILSTEAEKYGYRYGREEELVGWQQDRVRLDQHIVRSLSQGGAVPDNVMHALNKAAKVGEIGKATRGAAINAGKIAQDAIEAQELLRAQLKQEQQARIEQQRQMEMMQQQMQQMMLMMQQMSVNNVSTGQGGSEQQSHAARIAQERGQGNTPTGRGA